MYSAQNAADTSANATPAGSSECPAPPSCGPATPSVTTPVTASSTQPASRPRLERTAARVSGPRNWMVTAVPSGSRASAA
jgi:hypothetical protein